MKDANIKTMNQALRDHYQAKSLTDSQLDDLLMLQNNSSESEMFSNNAIQSKNIAKHNNESIDNDASKTYWWHLFLPDARNYRHAFYVTAFLLFGCLLTVYSLLDREPLSQRIMSEIVYNHNQDMPIEISSSSLTEISDYLSKLSFSIVLPNALSEPNWQLLGGRYCSINGKLAAQLKVKNLKDNSISTFYQAAVDKDFHKSNKASMSDTIDGVGVSIWREHGLLLGLAREKSALVK